MFICRSFWTQFFGITPSKFSIRSNWFSLSAVRLWSISLALAFVVQLPVFGQPDTTTPATDTKVTLSLDNADILDLVRWASDVTHKNIIVHPGVQGRVTVIAGDPMSPNEAYQVFLSVLQIQGFAVVESEDSLKIIPDALAKQSALPVKEGNQFSSGEDMVIQIVKAKNIAASDLINLLRPLMPQTGYMAAYPQTNTLIIADRSNNIQQMLSIIDRIDQVGTINIELIPIEFASAREVIDVVAKLLPQQNQNEPSAFTLAVDERSNSILMTGDPVTRQQIRSLIERLDQPLAGSGNTQVIPVQYAPAKDLVPILQSVSGSEQKKVKNQGVSQVEVNIQAHEDINALIITAPPALLSTMKGIIKQLDIRRAQVLVEALIVEVNEDVGNNLGVEWQTSPVNDGVGTVAGFSAFPSGIIPLGVNSQGEVTLGSGLSLGFFRGGDLRGIINALTGETNANILSTPTILALDNEEASILVGSSVPFVTGSQKRSGDDDPFQTIQREDIGVTLKIRPRINNYDSVTLEIEQSVESIGLAPPSVNTADIITNKREIKTKVLIDNNEVLVLGGLIRDEISETDSRVPILGKIPVLGALFRSRSTTVTKKNLMVFIHPVILHDGQSSRALSHDRYDQIRNKQLKFGHETEQFWIPGETPLLPELDARHEAKQPGNE